jgi:hypothetical protein
MADPESREQFESFYEKRRYSDSVERAVLRRLQSGHENFPDPVACPVSTCRTPLQIAVTSVAINLLCPNCGWHKIVSR